MASSIQLHLIKKMHHKKKDVMQHVNSVGLDKPVYLRSDLKLHCQLYGSIVYSVDNVASDQTDVEEELLSYTVHIL